MTTMQVLLLVVLAPEAAVVLALVLRWLLLGVGPEPYRRRRR